MRCVDQNKIELLELELRQIVPTVARRADSTPHFIRILLQVAQNFGIECEFA